MLDVRLIEPEKTYVLRQAVLRPKQSIESSQYEADYAEGAFHVGAFSHGKLICVATFIDDLHDDFSYDKQYRLRQMATDEAYRKLGAGRAVVMFGENIVKQQGVDFIWCKGRTTVQSYYEKLGFKPYGDVFDYPPIGPHIIMYKEI